MKVQPPEVRPFELLAPARDAPAARAAIDYGADAVYMGASAFGARHAAANTPQEIARVVDYAHLYGVRVYVTLNTLLYENELDEARRLAREVVATGVDALIVQDMAYLRMGLEGVEFHASTQTTNLTPEQVEFLAHSGFSRIVLERALSLAEIRAVRAATGAELECFVHGALCVGYSGRCYLSRTLGPRSGNRGTCSQPCRLGYDLVDGWGRTLVRSKHLLSLRDLDLGDRIGDLMDAGVASLKIEGRLKDTAYVRNTVAWYRARIDALLTERPEWRRASSGETVPDFAPDPARSFTRGAGPFFIDGRRAGVASLETPKATGVPLGKVTERRAGGFVLETRSAAGVERLQVGDGICFMTPAGLRGTTVERVEGGVFYPRSAEGIAPGVKLWRNRDAAFEARLAACRARRTIGVHIEAGFASDGVWAELTDADGHCVRVVRKGEYAPAERPEAAKQALVHQLSRSGGTIYRIDGVRVVSGAGPVFFVPLSELNELRREGLERLTAERLRCRRRPCPAVEERGFPAPVRWLGPEGNVVNSLAERFWRDHGVEQIDPGLDLSDDLTGERVMTSRYCIRRELGICLRERPDVRGPLRLVRGAHRWRLEFDCAACVMYLVDEGEGRGTQFPAGAERRRRGVPKKTNGR